jgi:regulator of protease activity HflC (stomatin/prohibitin superfamily)
MLLFILALIAFLIVLIGVGIAVFGSGVDSTPIGITTAVVAGLIGVILFVLSASTIVGPRNIGVVTTFGKVSADTLESGFHWKAPWSKVTDMDGTVQTTKYVGQDGCIGVRISDGQTACVSVVERHQTRIDSADELYVDYRSLDEKTDGDINDAINDALVRTQMTSALGGVFGSFDPLTEVGFTEGDAAAPAAPAEGIDYVGLSEELVTELNARLAAQSPDEKPQVEIVAATITFVYFSEKTQVRINQFQEEVAKTRIAAQRVETAEQEADANRELSASISNDPNVLVSKCLDLVAEGRDPGFSCWPMAAGGPALTAPVR